MYCIIITTTIRAIITTLTITVVTLPHALPSQPSCGWWWRWRRRVEKGGGGRVGEADAVISGSLVQVKLDGSSHQRRWRERGGEGGRAGGRDSV